MDRPPKMIIVGAGLVGCVAAQYMSKYGFNVIVYECRNDMRELTKKLGQSINLALSNRGIKALENVGIDKSRLLQMAVPVKGRMIHDEDDCSQLLYDVKFERNIYSIGRNDLNKLLIAGKEAEKNSKIYFGHKVVNVDLRTKKIKLLRINDNAEIRDEFDYLIGCDGAYSVIRQYFLKTPLFTYSQTYIDHGYIELRIPAQNSKEHQLPRNYLHIWPQSTFMMISLPNADGSWTVTLFMPFQLFHSIKTSEGLLKFFHKYFPNALPLLGKQNLIEKFFSSEPQAMISVKCNRYNYGAHCLIIGDAAHAVVPFFGQGMNAGFEDCYVLYETLKKYGPDTTFKEYSKIRTVDGNAISDLSVQLFRNEKFG